MENKKYKYVFFDLDHTLWDYDQNARDTLHELYDRYALDLKGARPFQDFFQDFLTINDELWSQFNVGKISKYFLRSERFRLLFERSGMDSVGERTEFLKKFNRSFMEECPMKGGVIDGTHEILNYLKTDYQLFIITNGFEETQTLKLKSSDILNFFEEVITSERAGSKKPAHRIFQYTMEHCQADLEQSIFIGDNLHTDVKGARDFGMDHVFFNPKKIKTDTSPTYEIEHLADIREIL